MPLNPYQSFTPRYLRHVTVRGLKWVIVKIFNLLIDPEHATEEVVILKTFEKEKQYLKCTTSRLATKISNFARGYDRGPIGLDKMLRWLPYICSEFMLYIQ